MANTLQTQNDSFTIIDGKVRVFKQWSSPFYNANFYHNRMKVQTSLKTADPDEAKQKAFNWFIESLTTLKAGLPIPSKRRTAIERKIVAPAYTFNTAAKAAMEALRDSKRSEEYLHSVELRMNAVCELIGHTDINEFTQASWKQFKTDLRDKKLPVVLSNSTMNNYKYAIADILREAHTAGTRREAFVFAREYAPKEPTSRTYFDSEAYKSLLKAIRRFISFTKSEKDKHVAIETRYFVLMMANFGARVGELSNARFKDFRFVMGKDENGADREYLTLTNIQGKMSRFGSDMIAQSYYGAPRVFRKLLAYHNLTEQNFMQSDKSIWTTTEKQRSNTFLAITREANLYETQDRETRYRVLASLRNTYIVFALNRQVPIADIAHNCRTSSDKIEKHYAKYRTIDGNKVNWNYADLD